MKRGDTSFPIRGLVSCLIVIVAVAITVIPSVVASASPGGGGTDPNTYTIPTDPNVSDVFLYASDKHRTGQDSDRLWIVSHVPASSQDDAKLAWKGVTLPVVDDHTLNGISVSESPSDRAAFAIDDFNNWIFVLGSKDKKLTKFTVDTGTTPSLVQSFANTENALHSIEKVSMKTVTHTNSDPQVIVLAKRAIATVDWLTLWYFSATDATQQPTWGDVKPNEGEENLCVGDAAKDFEIFPVDDERPFQPSTVLPNGGGVEEMPFVYIRCARTIFAMSEEARLIWNVTLEPNPIVQGISADTNDLVVLTNITDGTEPGQGPFVVTLPAIYDPAYSVDSINTKNPEGTYQFIIQSVTLVPDAALCKSNETRCYDKQELRLYEAYPFAIAPASAGTPGTTTPAHPLAALSFTTPKAVLTPLFDPSILQYKVRMLAADATEDVYLSVKSTSIFWLYIDGERAPVELANSAPEEHDPPVEVQWLITAADLAKPLELRCDATGQDQVIYSIQLDIPLSYSFLEGWTRTAVGETLTRAWTTTDKIKPAGGYHSIPRVFTAQISDTSSTGAGSGSGSAMIELDGLIWIVRSEKPDGSGYLPPVVWALNRTSGEPIQHWDFGTSTYIPITASPMDHAGCEVIDFLNKAGSLTIFLACEEMYGTVLALDWLDQNWKIDSIVPEPVTPSPSSTGRNAPALTSTGATVVPPPSNHTNSSTGTDGSSATTGPTGGAAGGDDLVSSTATNGLGDTADPGVSPGLAKIVIGFIIVSALMLLLITCLLLIKWMRKDSEGGVHRQLGRSSPRVGAGLHLDGSLDPDWDPQGSPEHQVDFSAPRHLSAHDQQMIELEEAIGAGLGGPSPSSEDGEELEFGTDSNYNGASKTKLDVGESSSSSGKEKKKKHKEKKKHKYQPEDDDAIDL